MASIESKYDIYFKKNMISRINKLDRLEHIEILKILNLDSKIKLHKVSSDHFEKEYFVKRPKSERLINKKLDLRGLNIMRDWKEALVEYLSNVDLNE